jgi:hypothetical protein
MTRLPALLALAVLGGIPAAVTAQQPAPARADEISMVRSETLQWTALEVPGFAPGATMTVVHGDLSLAQPYTMRLKFPDGYAFPAHFHPNAENVTVLSGSSSWATGRLSATRH